MKKGPWSAGEDKILSEYVRVHGEGNWNAVQRSTSLDRCGKSCRLRWANHLRPNLKKGSFSPHEERLIIDLHSSLGNKWARISAHLPGRTDNEVKNYWNTRVKRRLRQALPLYPNNHHNQNHHVPPPPPPPMPNLKTPPPSSVSFFDPASLPFPPPFFSFNQAPPLPKWIHPTSSFLFGSDFIPSVHAHAETEPLGLGLGLGFGFQSVLELPSNQFRPNLGLDYHDDDDDDEYEAIDEAKFDPNIYGRSDNSGLLDALLQEAQSRAEAEASKISLKNNNNNNDCLDGDQWDSLFGYSSTGMGKMEDSDDDKNYKNEDLSSILNLIPSLVTAPKWKEAEEEIAGFDLPQFPNNISSSNNTEWLNSSGSWENLPRIC